MSTKKKLDTAKLMELAALRKECKEIAEQH